VLFETEGIVLKRRKINHTDVFITLLSKNLGKVQVFIKGASNPRSSLNKGSHPFVCGHFTLRGDKTFSLSGVDIEDSFYHFREDLKKLSYGSYFLDFIDHALDEDQSNRVLYQLLWDSLQYLSNTKGVEERLKLYFELRALKAMGVMPQVHQCVNCGKTQEKFHAISIEEGGVVCDDCHKDLHQGMRIHSTMALLMDYVDKTKIGDFVKKEIDGLLVTKMDIFINSYVDYHLGLSNLKSKKFLKIYE
jgi:DNA repair protein RecO (recombination protein O)